MTLRICLVLMVALLASLQTARGDEPTPLWILSGQSNACGRAKLPGPPANDRVTIWDPARKAFVPAVDPLPHMGTRGAGAWVWASQAVAAATKKPIRLCGFARGGRPIAFWDPGAPGYQGLFPVIEKVGQNADVFLWYQGESDCMGRYTTAAYRQALNDHVARVRKAAGNPKLLAVIVQLGAETRKGHAGFMAIREAQRQFVVSDRHAILVPALGRTMKDSVHLDNPGYKSLGVEIGRALLRTRHEQDPGHWPGPVLDAAVLLPPAKGDRGPRSVAAHFAEVRQLQKPAADPKSKSKTPSAFAVIDAEGTNVCEVVKVEATRVSLRCERPVVFPARLIHGFGQNPRGILRDEAGNRGPAVQLALQRGSAPPDELTSMPNGAGR